MQKRSPSAKTLIGRLRLFTLLEHRHDDADLLHVVLVSSLLSPIAEERLLPSPSWQNSRKCHTGVRRLLSSNLNLTIGAPSRSILLWCPCSFLKLRINNRPLRWFSLSASTVVRGPYRSWANHKSRYLVVNHFKTAEVHEHYKVPSLRPPPIVEPNFCRGERHYLPDARS